MDMMIRARRKGGVEAGAEAQALRREEAEAETRRRARRGAGVGAEKESEAAAESAIAVAPEAKNVLGDTEHARALSENVPKVGAP